MSHYQIFRFDPSEVITRTNHVTFNDRHDIWRSSIGEAYRINEIMPDELSSRIGWCNHNFDKVPASSRGLGAIFKMPTLRGTV